MGLQGSGAFPSPLSAPMPRSGYPPYHNVGAQLAGHLPMGASLPPPPPPPPHHLSAHHHPLNTLIGDAQPSRTHVFPHCLPPNISGYPTGTPSPPNHLTTPLTTPITTPLTTPRTSPHSPSSSAQTSPYSDRVTAHIYSPDTSSTYVATPALTPPTSALTPPTSALTMPTSVLTPPSSALAPPTCTPSTPAIFTPSLVSSTTVPVQKTASKTLFQPYKMDN